MKWFSDLADLPEEARIRIIGEAVMSVSGQGIIGFVVDSEPGKADRYVRKLITRFPDIREIDRVNGPVKNTTTIRVCRKDKMPEKG